MNINQKDVVLLPYPFSNLEQKKLRPSVVISNNNFNKICNDFIAVPLTSVIKDEPFSLAINQNNFRNGKLIKPSRVRLDKIFSVERRLVQMKIGDVNDTFFDKLRSEIIEVF
ncbi:MAG: type II toxin-antitoxin system PemK/MazF family toxin [Nanoarchaeota archaeon]